MGLYRTKPEEVKAIRYTGDAEQPFGKAVPAWVWSAIYRGVLRLSLYGLGIYYGDAGTQVNDGDWLVLHSDNVIRACDDDTFVRHYTPARKRRGGDDQGEGDDQGLGTTDPATGHVGHVEITADKAA